MPNDTVRTKSYAYKGDLPTTNTSVYDDTLDGVPTRFIDRVAVDSEEPDENRDWVRKNLVEEVNDAVDFNREQIAIPQKDDWYSKVVTPALGELLKVEPTYQGDVATFKTPKDKLKDSKLTALEALRGNIAEEDLDEDSKANLATLKSIEAKGYTKEEIAEYIMQDKSAVAAVTPTFVSTTEIVGHLTDAYDHLFNADDVTPEELFSLAKQVAPHMTYIHNDVPKLFGYEESAKLYDSALKKQEALIQQIFKKHMPQMNVKLDVNSDWVFTDEQGNVAVDADGNPVSPESFVESMSAQKFEIGAGIAAGLATGWKAAKYTKNPYLTGIAATLGGTLGAVGGNQVDYLLASMKLHEDMSAKVAMTQAINTAEMDLLFAAAGTGITKLGKAGYNKVIQIKNDIVSKQYSRALTAMKDTFFMTEEAAEELVTKWSTLVHPSSSLSHSEEIIRSAIVTDPKSLRMISSAGVKGRTNIIQSIHDRAKEVHEVVEDLKGGNVKEWLVKEFDAVADMTKQQYARVKKLAQTSPNVNQFSFDYDKLAIKDAVTKVMGRIKDPTIIDKYIRTLDRIGARAEGKRSLPDLLDLRQEVNAFYSDFASVGDLDLHSKLLNNIDSEIVKGAKSTMEDSHKWLQQWGQAKKDYSSYLSLQNNDLYKVITKAGQTEDAIAKNMVKYFEANDRVYVEVMNSLPKAQRVKVEGAVLTQLVKSVTKEADSHILAVNFSELTRHLNKLHGVVVEPEAKKVVNALQQFSSVFRNEVAVADAAKFTSANLTEGGVSFALAGSPQRKSYLAMMEKTWDYMYRNFGVTKNAKLAKLAHTISKIMEEPIDAKTLKEVSGLSDGELVGPLTKLMQDRHSMPDVTIPVYGDGKYASIKKGLGGKATHLYPGDIATQAEVDALKNSVRTADDNDVRRILLNRGYKALQISPDKVRLLEKK